MHLNDSPDSLFSVFAGIVNSRPALNHSGIYPKESQLSDIGIGLLYFLSKILSFGLGNLKNVTFEFGTAYIAGAGLLNYLVALDAFDVASGKKK